MTPFTNILSFEGRIYSEGKIFKSLQDMLFIVEPCKASIYFYFHEVFQWIWFEFLLTTFFTTIFLPLTILCFCCEFKLAKSCDISIQYFERPHLTPHASPLQGNTVITFQDFCLITCHLTSGLSFFQQRRCWIQTTPSISLLMASS